VTTRLPAVHGAPVHIGFPEAIGIRDLGKPDYGDAVPIEAGELTHAPGCMLVTDLKNNQLSLF
jgi:uncharacterized protein YcsI (UPF0317 family)